MNHFPCQSFLLLSALSSAYLLINNIDPDQTAPGFIVFASMIKSDVKIRLDYNWELGPMSCVMKRMFHMFSMIFNYLTSDWTGHPFILSRLILW